MTAPQWDRCDGRPYLTPLDVSGYTVLRLDEAARRY